MEVINDKSKNESQYVIFLVQDEEFAVDIAEVKEIVRVMDFTKVPDSPDYIKGIINLRGQVITVIDTSKKFNLNHSNHGSDKARIIIFEDNQQTWGMLVDEVPEVLRVQKDQIKESPDLLKSKVDKKIIKGLVSLEDRLLLLLDLKNVMQDNDL